MPSISENEPRMRIWIEATFEMLRQGEIDGTHIEKLSELGCPLATADKLLTFLPLACGRAMLADTGVGFSPSFRTANENGRVGEPQSLSDDACWTAIDAWVSTHKQTEWDAVRMIGMQSAEFDAVNKALLNGSKFTDLAGSDPIFHWPNAESKTRPGSLRSLWRRITN